MTADRIRLLMGGDYDRIRLLSSPYVREHFGLDVEITQLALPHDAFHALTHGDEADGGELSLSFHSTLVSHPEVSDLVALPVFVSRFFRHGNILVNARAGINKPEDLRGKLVGVPEYGSTMAVWVRGMLADEHDVPARDIRWRSSRAPVALKEGSLRYPDDLDLTGIEGGLVANVARGDLDAMIGLVPDDLPDGVVRLYPDYEATERTYYQRTGIFPIMHVLSLRRRVLEAVPDLPERLFAASVWAKSQAIANLRNTAVLGATLPWLISAMEENTKIMGRELWPYGIQSNLKTIETFLRYAWEDGLLWREVTPNELFLHLNEDGGRNE